MLHDSFRPLRFPVNKCFPASLTHAQTLPLAVPLTNFLDSKKQEDNFRAHACCRWTTIAIAWAHQIWWLEIENSREVTVLLKAISLVLWIVYFPTKNVLHDKNRTFSTRVFSCRFSAVGFLDLLKTLKTQHQKSLFLYTSDFHWQSSAYLWFDFQTHGFTYQGRNAT